MFTIFIDAGFQNKLNTSAAFVDLSAAYDTVWRHGLINIFINAVRCKYLVIFLGNIFTKPTVLNVYVSQDKQVAYSKQ